MSEKQQSLTRSPWVDGGHSCPARNETCQQWLCERTTLHLFWPGKLEQETREHGVGFAVRSHLLQMITLPTEGTEMMLTLCLSSEQGTANILCIYAPTMSVSPETKDKFYEDLNTAVRNIPSNELLLLLRDFNARVGIDRDIWPTCLGHHRIGKMNKNEQ